MPQWSTETLGTGSAGGTDSGGGSGSGGGSTAGGMLDGTTLSNLLATQEYRGSGFVKLNSKTYESTLAPGSYITMYVSNDAAAAYEAVQPETNSAGAPFPVGGIVVREVSDAAGNVTLLTTMLKREAGFFATSGDFFFGVTDPKGQPVSDGGVEQWGALPTCGACHQGRASSGYLFGVSDANRDAALAHAAALLRQ